jgi:hypothetical protein
MAVMRLGQKLGETRTLSAIRIVIFGPLALGWPHTGEQVTGGG